MWALAGRKVFAHNSVSLSSRHRAPQEWPPYQSPRASRCCDVSAYGLHVCPVQLSEQMSNSQTRGESEETGTAFSASDCALAALSGENAAMMTNNKRTPRLNLQALIAGPFFMVHLIKNCLNAVRQKSHPLCRMVLPARRDTSAGRHRFWPWNRYYFLDDRTRALHRDTRRR
jgi:hypothetical protein